MKICNNSEIKKLIITFIFLIIVFLLIAIDNAKKSSEDANEIIIQNNSKLLEELIKKYPDDEEELVKILLNSKESDFNSNNILKKYGVTKSNIKNINSLENYRTNSIINNLKYLFLVMITIIVAIFIFIKKQYKKINQINNYTVNALNSNFPIEVFENDEGYINILRNNVYKVITSMKEQKETLQKDKVYLKNTLSDISHQLKTPLTSLIIMNDILKQDLSKEDKKEFSDKTKSNLERIEWLVSSLLKMSQLDSKTITLNKKEVNISKLINNALEPLLIQFELKNQSVIINGDNKLSYIGDFNWSKEAILNILKNANEHTPIDGKIEISWQDNPIYTEINIKDNGSGILKEELPYVFKRFYKSSSTTKESIGIGLAMSKNIFQNQNGDITVKSKKNEYTIFQIKIYKK